MVGRMSTRRLNQSRKTQLQMLLRTKTKRVVPRKETTIQMPKPKIKLTTNWSKEENLRSLRGNPWKSSSTRLANLTRKHTPLTDMLFSDVQTIPFATSETSSTSRRMTSLVDLAWWSVAPCARHSWCSPLSLPWWSLLLWRRTTDSWKRETLSWMPNTRPSTCVMKNMTSLRLLLISQNAPKNANRRKIESLRLRWRLRRKRSTGRWKPGRKWKTTLRKEISEETEIARNW